jgi:phosphatidylserine/phosphatidylglycerophosphate/cardiolipin synthase-like enzyme
MRIRFNLGFALFAVASIFTAHSVFASIDLVESVPLETNLAVPGIETTQAAWIELFQGAQSTIDIEQFYISSGDSLIPVLDALKAAAARGVQVRIIVDSQFYVTYPNDVNALGQVPNIQFKTINVFAKAGGIMHAKYMVIDSQKAYVGSANFDWLALSHIHEVGAKIDDVQVGAGLESIFNMDWGMGTTQQQSLLEKLVPSFLTLYASPGNDLPGGVNQTLPALLSLIQNTKQTLNIQMYEYATSIYGSSAKFLDLDHALRAAAARGVKIQLAVDQTALKAGKKDLEALAKIANIEVRVITIPQWSGGPLQYARVAHSKYLVSDHQTLWVGSENWQGDYFNASRNVGVITNDQASLTKIGQTFTTVWNSGYTSAP